MITGRWACAVVLVLATALALASCSGGDKAPDASPDASLDASADAGPAVDGPIEGCNYLANTGCLPGEKCTLWWTAPEWIEFASVCAPDGDRGPNESCTIDGESGLDDCQRGFLCHDGTAPGTTCSQICTTLDDGCESGLCVAVDGIFGSNDGVCVD
jgi:hypothetical protein